jgi:hypothetical protein
VILLITKQEGKGWGWGVGREKGSFKGCSSSEDNGVENKQTKKERQKRKMKNSHSLGYSSAEKERNKRAPF